MSNKKEYGSFNDSGDKFFPNSENHNSINRLSPGCYSLHVDDFTGQFWFASMKINHDAILDLPSPEYSQVVKEMTAFMRPEKRKMFETMGYLYKRSTLLHGLPGTGKTIIVNRIARDIVKAGGICLWSNGNIQMLKHGLKVLSDVQPDVLTGVIIEEIDSLMQKQESNLLTLLDGQVQKDNVIYLATTNYLSKIPKRIYRPGRFASVIEVKFPIADARRMYLESKIKLNSDELNTWVDRSAGLSIDELKEVVQAVGILDGDMTEVIGRLKATRESEPQVGAVKHLGFADAVRSLHDAYGVADVE